VRILPPGVPPELPVSVSWRELWRSGAFVQRDLTWSSNFSSKARERDLRLGTGDPPLEELDLVGSLQPIAFAAGGNPPLQVDLRPFEPNMRFREEQPARPWSEYAWDAHGHPHTTALYSPWQLLYLDDVVARSGERVPLSLLTAPPEKLSAWLDRLRGLLGGLEASWASLDDAWQPLLKLLVRVQNRYLPEVTRRSTFLWDAERRVQVEPWGRELEVFDAKSVAAHLGVEAEQVLSAYWFLTERGVEREPHDSMELLRRARPRSAHAGWRGLARQAEDHFEAAQVLRFFLTDLSGTPPARPSLWPMDGRQVFRAFIYERGPVPDLTRDEVRTALLDRDLRPHAVHVVGEGKSERDYVETLASGLVGAGVAGDIGFSDLKGSGSARHLPTIVRGLATYVDRTVVIVDSEGKMAKSVEDLERTGELPPEDILHFSANIEDDNFTIQELIDALIALAADPPDDRPAVALNITTPQFEAAYQERRGRAREKPGKAGVLLQMAEHADPPARFTKPEFARALAGGMLAELSDARGDEAASKVLLIRRPLLRFTLERIVPPLLGQGDG
jgi:hypothetical protein